MSVRLAYDRKEAEVGELVTATALAMNRDEKEQAPMVMLELPIPAGFALELSDFEKLQSADQRIAKYQAGPRSVLVYLRSIAANASVPLEYRLRAVMPVRVTGAAAHIYEYYDPARQGFSVYGGAGGEVEQTCREARCPTNDFWFWADVIVILSRDRPRSACRGSRSMHRLIQAATF